MNWYVAEEDNEAETERLLNAWSDAPIESLEVLDMILDTARIQVLDYGPTQPENTDPPKRFVLAQLMQAKALWNAGRTDQNGDVGSEGFTFTPRPLDKATRGVIRPVKGRPRVY